MKRKSDQEVKLEKKNLRLLRKKTRDYYVQKGKYFDKKYGDMELHEFHLYLFDVIKTAWWRQDHE